MESHRHSGRLRAAGTLVVGFAVLVVLVGCSDGSGGSGSSARPTSTADSAAVGSSVGTASAVDPSQPATSPLADRDTAGAAGPQPSGSTGSEGGGAEASGDGETDAGGDGTQARAGGTGASPSESALTYSNPDYAVEFSYPADWRLTEDVSAEGTAGGSAVQSIGVFDPRGTQRNGVLLDGMVISIYQLATTVDESLIPVFKEEVASLLPQLEGHLNDFLAVEPLRPATVDGLAGFETTYTFTQDGQELRNRLLFLVDGDIEYQLTIQAAAAEWDSLLPSFETILGTLRSTR